MRKYSWKEQDGEVVVAVRLCSHLSAAVQGVKCFTECVGKVPQQLLDQVKALPLLVSAPLLNSARPSKSSKSFESGSVASLKGRTCLTNTATIQSDPRITSLTPFWSCSAPAGCFKEMVQVCGEICWCDWGRLCLKWLSMALEGCRWVLWNRRPPPPCHGLDDAWDLGRRGMGRPKCPRLHLRKMPGLEQALWAGIVQTQSAQPHRSLSRPTHQWEDPEGDQQCHHAEGTRETMVLAEEEWAAGDNRSGLARKPVPGRAWVRAKVNCKMFRCLNSFVVLVFL